MKVVAVLVVIVVVVFVVVVVDTPVSESSLDPPWRDSSGGRFGGCCRVSMRRGVVLWVDGWCQWLVCNCVLAAVGTVGDDVTWRREGVVMVP